MKRLKASITRHFLSGFLSGSALLLFLSLPLYAADHCPAAKSNTKCPATQGDVKCPDCPVKELKQEIQTLQQKVEKLEKDGSYVQEDIDDLGSRVDKTELHTTTDKVSFGVYFRTEANSLHYDNILGPNPQIMQAFFTPYNPTGMGGFNGATLPQIQQAIYGMAMAGMIPDPASYDANNDILYTNKFRTDMKAILNNQISFAGRLSAYKVFGDSTEVKFNQGSLGDVNFDGTTSSLPRGDVIRLERAYFVYNHDLNNVPVSFSLGRRPATDGPPLEYGNYSLVGGSPLATIINWQFDGASLSFGLEDVTNIPGASFKLCYGVGFESDWGNSTSLNYMASDIKDVHLVGFISDFYNDGASSVMFNYAHAWDITDGFTGTTVMPFIIKTADSNGDGEAEYTFEQNAGGYISRMEPMTNIGDWDAGTLLFRTNLSKSLEHDIDFFLAGSASYTDPSRISNNPFYKMMGMGLLSSNGQLESHDGYSIYTGALFPMPLNARLGLEYNYGSKYWFNFTGAEDSVIGSKMAVRGDVYEAYYIQPIFKKNFFVKVGTQFYDYAYTGSGNPLGAPVKISDATALDAINPVVNEVWNYYASATFNF
jgi:hypothetical protein